MVDALLSKSSEVYPHVGSTPTSGTSYFESAVSNILNS